MTIEAVRSLALSLPKAVETPHFDATSFRVGGRIFATVPADGRHLHVFVDEQERLLALAMSPDAMAPLPWGKRIMGVRIDLGLAEPKAVAHLLQTAWRHKAPRRLLAAQACPR